MHSSLSPRVFSSLLLLARCPDAGCVAGGVLTRDPGEGSSIGPLKRSGGDIAHRPTAEEVADPYRRQLRSGPKWIKLSRFLRSVSGALRGHCGRNPPESTGSGARRGPTTGPVDAVARSADPPDSGGPIRGSSGPEYGPRDRCRDHHRVGVEAARERREIRFHPARRCGYRRGSAIGLDARWARTVLPVA